MKLDLGCGTKKRDGYIGVDSRQFDGVDVVCNLGTERWPWGDDTVSEVYCSHMVEHLTPGERVHFVNELWRVLKRGARAEIITPHWASCRAYGDLTHQWPPVSEFWYPYLSKTWRETQAPHNDSYSCDFESITGYVMNPALAVRNVEFQQHAVSWFKESASDMVATLTKRG